MRWGTQSPSQETCGQLTRFERNEHPTGWKHNKILNKAQDPQVQLEKRIYHVEQG